MKHFICTPSQTILTIAAATPAWCKPCHVDFGGGPWQHPSVSLLRAVSFTAAAGIFSHSGDNCHPCGGLHLEQRPSLVVAFEVPHGLPLCLWLSVLSLSSPPLVPEAGPGPCPRVAGSSCWRSIISNVI